ncbi:addiction module protein [candidate division KSB1 bacterium]|nr:addiction module protein [candidate division KSB1 bacterium]
MQTCEMILEYALKLKPADRAQLIEGLIASMEKPDSEIERLWEQEVLKRYATNNQKTISAKNFADVLKKV